LGWSAHPTPDDVNTFVVRGFIPDRLRSSRKISRRGVPAEIGLQGLGPLRSPSGINPLATVMGSSGAAALSDNLLANTVRTEPENQLWW
jgi:hypothetical protein